jgi:hypothetical protein
LIENSSLPPFEICHGSSRKFGICLRSLRRVV